MSEDYVRLTANAGALIVCGGKKILLDALHRKQTRFSGVDEGLAGTIIRGEEEFSGIDCMLVTHDHPDHYEENLTRAFLAHHPETTVLTPTALSGERVFHLTGPEGECVFDHVKIRYRRLVHDGEEYAGIVNYGFVVTAGKRTMLMLGDATFDGDSIGKLVGNDRIDTAFLNFPFVTLLRGKRIVREVIRPRQTVIFHLPFVEDDVERYLETTRYIVKKDGDKMPPSIVLYQKNQAAELTDVPNA